ncbi:MAG: ABC transporter, ATP-binding protein 2 (cluster 4, leucine/isoleucine/valine/benzoate) [uncultured Caballeronia sp.]|nr:MAG: ABC transporter, ATP-binding protein 2 (cluster 4, leucine/isoleucine/valine/benzoate) [uncultured Caballeronia sp.]
MKEIFHIVSALRQTGVATLLIEQNARAALQISDYGSVLKQANSRWKVLLPSWLTIPRLSKHIWG